MKLEIKKIGQGVQRCRIEKQMTQQALAEKVGISVRYIAEIERGGKIPKLETFISILNALDASADAVLAESLNTGYHVNAVKLEQAMEPLSSENRKLILNVVETIIETVSE